MGLPARFAANHPAVVDEMIDGEVVVIDLRSGNYFSLVESAAVSFLKYGVIAKNS